MAVKRVKPKRLTSKGGRVVRRRAVASTVVPVIGPTFRRLTVSWVQQNGVPFDTTGFFARLYQGSRIVQTAAFDRFGVVRFSRVPTLTDVPYTIRVIDENGVQYRQRTIPAGVQTYAIIG
ncbi:hypothetical protein DNH61_17050 [Paenibacillus sambharensis]|uniref:Uncharacterized protein n=1 Tax=Paenibacillus sambharensis TaxID=1803190 RepID=A0A2W1L950_9BACL|nr:hypothetical protein [Paenibacillus sambharensis]PZD94660.1 hypothetical protein DNH61_17050 [Paenibacillus sambharensis]